MKKWTVEIVGKDEASVIKHIKGLLAAFEMAVTLKEPLHCVHLIDKGTSVKCNREDI